MKKTLLFVIICVLSLVGCTNSTTPTICKDLVENTYSDGGFEFSEWGGYRWFVIPLMNDSREYCSKYMYIDGTDSDLPVILEKITEELGEPIAQQVTNPEQLAKYTSQPHVFALPNNRELQGSETLYWWDTEEYVVSLFEAKAIPEVDMVANAIVSLYDKQKLPW